MMSSSSILLLVLCICAVLGTRRNSKRGDSPPLRVQRELPGRSGSRNRLRGFGKNPHHPNEKSISWPGKDEAAIELEEEPDDWEDFDKVSADYDYMQADPLKHNQHDRMRPQEMALMKLASDNARRVMDEGKCAYPARRCVPVTSNPGKKYWPTCALVHRCDDSTGCCTSEQHSCQPKDSDHIDLYFYVYVATDNDVNLGGAQRLTFRNDTSCECKTKPKVQQRSCPNTTPRCKCPKHFESVIRNGQCACDCSPSSGSYKSCRRYKRGKKFFTQTCLRDGKCTEPTCEYGSYLPSNNRCMRKSEKDKKKKRTRHK